MVMEVCIKEVTYSNNAAHLRKPRALVVPETDDQLPVVAGPADAPGVPVHAQLHWQRLTGPDLRQHEVARDGFVLLDEVAARVLCVAEQQPDVAFE